MICSVCGTSDYEVIEVFGQHLQTQVVCRRCLIAKQEQNRAFNEYKVFLRGIAQQVASAFVAERSAMRRRWNGAR